MSDFLENFSMQLWITRIDITRRQHAVFYECISLCTCSCGNTIICWIKVVFHIPVCISLVIVVVSIFICSLKIREGIGAEYICRLIP